MMGKFILSKRHIVTILVGIIVLVFNIIYFNSYENQHLIPVSSILDLKSKKIEDKAINITFLPLQFSKIYGKESYKISGCLCSKFENEWADNPKTELWLLGQDGKVFTVPMERAFNNSALALSCSKQNNAISFVSGIEKTDLPAGTYQVGVGINSEVEGIKHTFSSRYLVQTRNTIKLLTQKELNAYRAITIQNRIKTALQSIIPNFSGGGR